MIVWIVTDMEGLAGVDQWEQCYDADDASPRYRHGLEQLTADANAVIAGCFDGGASEVRVLDGHGRNRNKGFLQDKIDRRARQVWVAARDPLRWEGLDESIHAIAIIGQHAMAGTINGFIDHTQMTQRICRFKINGQEHGEMSQAALAGGALNVPLVYVSGDEACCAEANRLFPWAVTTPTKRGTGWHTCELYDAQEVRQNIRRDMAEALRRCGTMKPWKPQPPIEVEVEFAYSGAVDELAKIPGVTRPHARIARWHISNPLDIWCWPSATWRPT